MKKTASEKLYDLWFEMKKEENCTDYVEEMISQLTLLGRESNTLTNDMIRSKVEELLNAIQPTPEY